MANSSITSRALILARLGDWIYWFERWSDIRAMDEMNGRKAAHSFTPMPLGRRQENTK